MGPILKNRLSAFDWSHTDFCSVADLQLQRINGVNTDVVMPYPCGHFPVYCSHMRGRVIVVSLCVFLMMMNMDMLTSSIHNSVIVRVLSCMQTNIHLKVRIN